MGLKKIKISELPLANTLYGFFTIGYRHKDDGSTESVRAGLEFICDAAENANNNANLAANAAKEANMATSAAKEATDNTNSAIVQAREAAQNANGAADDARKAAQDANEAAGTITDKLDKTGDGADVTVTFTEASLRENVNSGDKLSVLFGKVKRWFDDLKTVAFTGRAADLTQDADNRLVTDAEKAGWADKYTRAEVDNKDADVLKEANRYTDVKNAELVGSAPETLNALDELAAALGNDPNFSTSIMALIGGKADLVHTHSKAQITDFPAALPANGGNADTVDGKHSSDLFVSGVLSLNHSDLDTFVNRTSGTYRVYDGASAMCLIVFRNPAASASGVEMYVGYGEDDHIQVRKTVDSNRYTAWKSLAYTTDIPTTLPANGGNAEAVGGYNSSILGRIIESTVSDIDDTPGFWSSGYSPNTKGSKPSSQYGSVLQVSNSNTSPMTGGQNWLFQLAHAHGIDRPMWRRQYNSGGWTAWKQLALMDDIPSSLPANGGNADTVGGYFPSYLMKRNSGTEIQADAILGTSQYGFGYENRGFPTSGSFISFGGITDDYTTQIIAEYKGYKIYFRTYDGDLKKWNNWQRIALHDKTLGNTGDQTLSNGRLNMLVSAPEHVIMFKDAAGNIGYIGFGAYPSKDLQIMNYATGKYINIAADGKLYYDRKELAFKSDIGSGGDNWYPTIMNWTDGSVQGPRLNLSGVGMAALSATIPIAGVSVSGVVTTTNQVFTGRKSFAAGIDIIAGGMAVDGGIAVSNGTIVCSGEVSAAYFFCTDEVVAASFFGESDVRLKKNISPINLTEKGRIRLCEFDKSGRHSYGVIAQEVEKLYPTAVKENHGRKVVNYIEILTIKCAEQDERIEALEKENQELKDRLERLEKLLLK